MSDSLAEVLAKALYDHDYLNPRAEAEALAAHPAVVAWAEGLRRVEYEARQALEAAEMDPECPGDFPELRKALGLPPLTESPGPASPEEQK